MKIKLKSKILSVLLVCMLMIGLFPITAFAAEDYKITVAGTQVTSNNASDVLGDGTVSYDHETKTLKLNGATLNGGIYIDQNSPICICVQGDNTITSSVYGITKSNFSGGELLVSGDGSLEVNAKADAIGTYSNLIIDGVELIINTPITPLATYTDNEITIKNGANITATSEEDLAILGGNINILDSTVDATAKAAETNVFYASENIFIDNSTVKATGTSEEAFPAIYAARKIVVTNNSDILAISNGMRGIFTDGDMTITDSFVTATGATQEGMVVVGTLTLNNSSLTASSKPDNYIPAIVTKNFNITNSEITANGGFDLFDWNSGNTDSISLRITPANGKLTELKVDGENWDGSAPKHFKEGSESPYDSAVNFSADEMNWLGAYRYIHIGEHIHTGGTATCTEPTICEDCGRAYGNALGHNAVKTERKEATCIEDGNIEYWYCDVCSKYFSDEALTKEITKEGTVVKATGHGETELKNAKEATCTVEGYTGDKVCKVCGLVAEKGKVTAKAAHNFKDGKCTVCKATDPNYVPTKPTVPEKGDKESPQTGDSTNIALWFAIMLTAGTVLTGTVLYSKKKKCSK